MPLVQLSNRCKLFESISENTWRDVIYHHNVHIQMHEPGQTNRIIADIRHSALAYPNIEVWANNGFREIDHGSDIDIFVESKPGEFIWWALQAKVLRLNGRYEGLSNLHGNEYQWDKLNRLSAASGCVVRYLLYNGLANYHCNGNDICTRNFNEDQFGCSLVKTTDVERLALAGPVSFHDFHPDLAQPWRIITCCLFNNNKEKATYYSATQVREAVKTYPNRSDNISILDITDSTTKPNDFSDNAINEFSSYAERKPEYRIVIRSTKSINENK